MSGQARQPGIRSYGAVLALAAAVRIAWALLVPVVPISDCHVYDGAAQRLAQGLPYTIDAASTSPSAHWPIGTSFMYSLVYRMFDPQTAGYAPVVVLNLLIGLVVVGLSMAVAARWFGRRAGLMAGVVMALWPMHIQFTTVIASEPIFTACILAGLLAWPRISDDGGRGIRGQGAGQTEGPRTAQSGLHVPRLIIAGLCFAAATYTRPTSLLFPIVLGGIEFLRTRKMVVPALRTAIATAVLLAALAPWTLRNYRVFDRLVLVSTNGGTNMWMGNNPDTTGHYQSPPTPDAGQNEAVWDKELGNRAKAYIRQDPGAFVKRTLVKAVKLHDRETIGVAWNLEGLKRRSAFFDTGPGARILKAVSSGYWYLVLALGGVGGLLLIRRDGLWGAITHPAAVFFAYFTAVHAIMVIQDRYHFPITPMVAALASVAIVTALDKRAASHA